MLFVSRSEGVGNDLRCSRKIIYEILYVSDTIYSNRIETSMTEKDFSVIDLSRTCVVFVMMECDSLCRMKGEPMKSHRRFELFVNFDGTLKDFEVFLRDNHSDISAGLSQLQKDSSRWEWQRRINEYKHFQESVIRERTEDIFCQLNYGSIEDMSAVVSLLNELKCDVMDKFRRNELSSATALRLLREYVRIYKEVTEIYYINSRHSLQPMENQDSNSETAGAVSTFVEALQGLRE